MGRNIGMQDDGQLISSASDKSKNIVHYRIGALEYLGAW